MPIWSHNSVIQSNGNGRNGRIVLCPVGRSECCWTVTRLEVLGYHRLSQKDFDRFRPFFNLLDTLPVTNDLVEYAVNLRRSRSMGLADAIIAATCLVHHLSLVSNNVRDFSWIKGLNIIDPLNPPH
ncbi:MAG: type II toxin-antitoxin system VapC family toxin [Magnetococcales bacterium]|nr:type II toxin-antitoxin system VapC family toxin [Magnetococcales bacterium]